MTRIFIETPSFTKKWQSLGLTDDDLRTFEEILLKDPKTGDPIQNTGGIRKLRIKISESSKGGMNMGFYEDLEKSLLEAVEIDKGNIPMHERDGMPEKTLYASTREIELIDEMIRIRKEQRISQVELANLTGNKQQSISRMEKKENSPSLKNFLNVLHALGYDLTISRKTVSI